MTKDEFISIRMKLKKTQKQMAELLGVSIRSVQSFEQGWRKISSNIERHALYLLIYKDNHIDTTPPCWDIEDCPQEKRIKCPAWEFDNGKMCWFINGTLCQGEPHHDWETKMKHCRECEVFKPLEKLITEFIEKEKIYQ